MKIPNVVLLTVSFLLLTACGGSSGGEDGLSTNSCSTLGLGTADPNESVVDLRIINGTECTQTNSPVVRLTIFLVGGEASLCTGSVLTDRYVLTAAHCFLSPTQAAFVEADGISIPAKRVFVHPDVMINEEVRAVINDAAIVELSEPISLPALPIVSSRGIAIEDQISIFGYGLDETSQLGLLRSGEMRVREVTPNHIFAPFDGDGSNTCNGDSGGPAVLQFQNEDGATLQGVVGVVSTGDLESCQVGDVSAFTNLQSESVLNFIRNIVPNAPII